MTTPEYSGARHDDIRRQQTRRARVPPLGVNLNAYYGISDQIIVVTAEAIAVFIHRRTGTLYFFHEQIEGFVNAYDEAYLGLWIMETPHLAPPMTPLQLPFDLSAYPTAAFEREWFIQAEAAQTGLPVQATLALAFQIAIEHYPLMAHASFATAKANFENARAAKTGPKTPLNKPTFGVVGASASAGPTAVGTSSAVGAGARPSYQQRQITRVVGQPFANIIPPPGDLVLPMHAHVSQFHSPYIPLHIPPLVDSSIPSRPAQPPWPSVLQPSSPHSISNYPFPQRAQSVCLAQYGFFDRHSANTRASWVQRRSGTPWAAGSLLKDRRRARQVVTEWQVISSTDPVEAPAKEQPMATPGVVQFGDDDGQSMPTHQHSV